jgi:hypothetical protein
MNQSVQMEKSNLSTLEKRARDLDTKVEMMSSIDQVYFAKVYLVGTILTYSFAECCVVLEINGGVRS